MKAVALAIAMTFAVSAPAWALSYDGYGRVVVETPYAGPGLGVEDAAFLAVAATAPLAYHAWGPSAGYATPSVAFITWGAWRTNKYRPDDVKQRIRAEIKERESAPMIGTAAWLLSD